MEVPTKFDKCIICLEKPADVLEHIIPECIGGRLKVRLLCESCNNIFGSNTVSKVKKDPEFILAIEYLKYELVDLANDFLEKVGYVGYSPNGSTVKLTKQGHKLKVLSKMKDDILEIDTEETSSFLFSKLNRANISKKEIEKLKKIFDEIENLKPLKIPTGEVLQKVPIERVVLDLSGASVDNKFWVIMAYEFLSLVIGREIYHAYFDQVRDFILTGNVTQNIAIGSFQGSKTYETNHVLGIEPKDDRLIVYVRLFGWIFQRVTFFKVSGEIMDIVFYEDLKNQKSLIAINRDNAKRGVWLEVK